ncbi:hypothetical protein BU15DRAFT_65211 [Melanogaster broomeanus]|nr:hypothetical protein BU15DRAFT_65211 [Melanogaster broomeanus]
MLPLGSMAGLSLKSPVLQHALRRRIVLPQSSLLQRRTFASSSSSQTSSPIRTVGYTVLFALSAGLFAAYYFDARSSIHRYVLTPTLRHIFDAETGHKIAVKVLRSGLAPRDPLKDDDSLRSEVFGQKISNPVGLAAGFDKDGEAIDGPQNDFASLCLLNLGFSWVEIGSVTPKAQPGNPRPRVFHLPADDALINRYGFPSQGAAAVVLRLRARIPTFHEPDASATAALRPGSVLAVNLGKNKTSAVDSSDDFVTGVKTFGPGLQNRELLESLLADVVKARNELEPSPITSRRPRLILKIAPDLQESQIIDMAEVIRNSDIDGKTKWRRAASRVNPSCHIPCQALRTLRAHLPPSIPLIGCGGITSGADALEYARAGASLVQVYTGTCRRIKDELVSLLNADGKTWSAVVNEAVQTLSWQAPESPPPVQAGDATIGKLIGEAEELKLLLDRLGEKLG